jgi:hypothetical protein
MAQAATRPARCEFADKGLKAHYSLAFTYPVVSARQQARKLLCSGGPLERRRTGRGETKGQAEFS